MRITEGQLRKIVHEEILRLRESSWSSYDTPAGMEIDKILGPHEAAWNPTEEDGVIRVTFDPGMKPLKIAAALAALKSSGLRVREKYRGGALVEVPESLRYWP